VAIPRRAALRACTIVIPSSIGPTPSKPITALPSIGFGLSPAGRAEAAAAGSRARRAVAARRRFMARH
jgi:hypothetical protein